MIRRNFLQHSFGAALLGAAPSFAMTPTQKKTNSLVELRQYKLRNTMDGMPKRLNDFLSQAQLPALKRAGVAKLGYFGNLVGNASPYTLELIEYKNFAQWESTWEALAADKAYAEATAAAERSGLLRFLRLDTSLLRSFDGLPAMEMPASEPGRPPRVFELRTYESNSHATLGRKIGMFNNGEIAIFRKTGLNPVFFGETIIGANAPNLTYMLWYDNLAARETNWKKFVTHPEWEKLKATPGLSDGEVVSNISNSLLNPMAFSPIR
ncbi:MAG: NIPSNAP family protein [Bryobacter sp.]|nr:NIPSNAP family protein [Bryobacter sp.]